MSENDAREYDPLLLSNVLGFLINNNCIVVDLLPFVNVHNSEKTDRITYQSTLGFGHYQTSELFQ